MPSGAAHAEVAGVAAGDPPGKGPSPGCEADLEVSLSIGPIEQREVASVLQAMTRLADGASWSRIQQDLLSSQASTRTHLITHRLVAAVAHETSCTARDNQAGGLELRFLAPGIPSIRELAEALRMLRTPFSMTVGSPDPDSGRLSAFWDLGWDEADVGILGRPPRDRRARGALWERLEQLLAG